MSLIVDIKKKVKGFDLDIKFQTEGAYLGLLGASGSGKSMTLKCIAGVETPDEGFIILNGKILFDSNKNINLKPQDRNIGYLFQNYALFPHMTIEENIGMGLERSNEEKSQKVNEMVKAFQLKGLENKYPNKISGGQQQRVALARAMIYEPDILMLDEPFSAMDSHLKEQLQSSIQELLKFYNGEILMVSHSRDEIYRLCKKLAIIHKGKNILVGETKDIFKHPKSSIAAKLVGCQNISKCDMLSSNHLYAKDWDIILNIKEAIPQGVEYVGIRAEEFKIVEDKEDEDNIISCRVEKIIEDVLQYHIFFQDTQNNKPISKDILFKVDKDKWINRKNKDRLYIKIPDDAIMLLRAP